jgi:hypothetical protein
MTTVRKQKSSDQLAVGDWLAPGQLLNGAAEVLHVLAYRPKDYDLDKPPHVHLVVREQGKVAPWADIVSGNTLFDLASDADLAVLHERAEREKLANELRELAEMILNPAMPVPQYGITIHGSFGTPAEVRAAAELFSVPVESREPHKGIQTLEWPVGRKSYEQGIHLFWFTIADETAEPQPEPDDLGDAFDRSQTADADETPVPDSRRYPAHTGAVTDGGLVDETDCPPWCGIDGPKCANPRHEDGA